LLAIVFKATTVATAKQYREQSSVDRLLLQKTLALGSKTGNKKPGRRTFRVFCFAA